MEVGYHYPPFVLGPFWPSRQPLTSWAKPFSPFISTPPRCFSNRTSPPTECVSSDCPVRRRHHKYEYWHGGKQPHREDWEVFHGSNPPGAVWLSYNRLQCRRGCGDMADIERVREFRRHHGCKTDDLLWRSQEKVWEVGILVEGERNPERKGKTTTGHRRATPAEDYPYSQNKSPYYQHRMQVLKNRQRQKDRRDKILREPPSSPKEFPEGKLGRGLRSIVNFLESI